MAKHTSVLLCLFAFVAMAGATQFKVGGSNGWSVPAPNTVSYNQWAEMNRFQIGDSVLFTYQQGKDSVLVVDQDAYKNCNTTSYIKRYDDGNTVFTFDQSGPFFFISGNRDNCLKNESLIIVVLADRTKPHSPPMAPTHVTAPSPPPSTEIEPTPSTSSTPPSPSTEPPSTSGEQNLSSPPPPNSSSMKFVGIIGSMGPVLGLVMLFL